MTQSLYHQDLPGLARPAALGASDLNHREGQSAAHRQEWKVGDRCRVESLGEWRNATIVSLSFQAGDKQLALVVRDGEKTKRARFLSSLGEPVDE